MRMGNKSPAHNSMFRITGALIGTRRENSELVALYPSSPKDEVIRLSYPTWSMNKTDVKSISQCPMISPVSRRTRR